MNGPEKQRLKEWTRLLKMARQLWEAGQIAEARATLDEAIAQAERGQERWSENRTPAWAAG
jgi:hypothetical protein